MARPSLDRILGALQESDPGFAEKPIEQTAQAITDAAAEGARSLLDTERENTIAATVRGWYTAAKSARSATEQKWLKNLDMYRGAQFTQWDEAQKKLIGAPNPQGEPRKVVNIILPTCRTEMAKTGSTHPTATVSPASDDQSDLMAAMAAERAWEWFYNVTDFHTTTFTPANWWRTVTGNGFGKVYWDASSVDPAAQEAAKQQRAQVQAQLANANVDPGALAAPAPKPVLGQIRTKPVTPFHIFVPDLTELSLQDQRWVIHAYTIPTATAKLLYGPLRGPDWQPQEAARDTLVDPKRIGVSGSETSTKDTVLVVEAWVKPGTTGLLPAGGYVVLVGSDLVGFVDSYPYQHGLFPFFHLPSVETGSFYRASIIEYITDIQDEKNRTLNQQIKNRNFVTANRMFYDEGSVDPTRVRPVAGQWIPIRLGMKDPRPVVETPLPQWVDAFHDRLATDRDDITGQHQVSRAQSPGADSAASMVALLREADDDYLSTVYDYIRVAMTQTARMTIGLMVQFWDEPRLVKTVGREESAGAKILKAADLVGGTDISIDGDSMLPQSKSAKIATITEWMDKGYVPPNVGLDVLEMGQLGPAYKRMKIDVNHARRETVALGRMDLALIMQHSAAAQQMAQQQALMQPMDDIEQQQAAPPAPAGPQPGAGGGSAGPASVGQPMAPPEPESILPVGWQDNHLVHIEEHKAFAKTQEYEAWEPERQEQLRLHVAAHEREVMLTQPPVVPDPNAVASGELAAGAPAAVPPGYAEQQAPQGGQSTQGAR